jgi:hypothetical protein
MLCTFRLLYQYSIECLSLRRFADSCPSLSRPPPGVQRNGVLQRPPNLSHYGKRREAQLIPSISPQIMWKSHRKDDASHLSRSKSPREAQESSSRSQSKRRREADTRKSPRKLPQIKSKPPQVRSQTTRPTSQTQTLPANLLLNRWRRRPEVQGNSHRNLSRQAKEADELHPKRTTQILSHLLRRRSGYLSLSRQLPSSDVESGRSLRKRRRRSGIRMPTLTVLLSYNPRPDRHQGLRGTLPNSLKQHEDPTNVASPLSHFLPFQPTSATALRQPQVTVKAARTPMSHDSLLQPLPNAIIRRGSIHI